MSRRRSHSLLQLSVLNEKSHAKDDDNKRLEEKLTGLVRKINCVLFRLNEKDRKSAVASHLRVIKNSVLASFPHMKSVICLAVKFSPDQSTPVNGYATLIDFYHNATDQIDEVIKLLWRTRHNLPQAAPFLQKTVKAWAVLLTFLEKVICNCLEILAKQSSSSLSIDYSKLADEDAHKLQKSLLVGDYFGRTLAFQYTERYASYLIPLTAAFAACGDVLQTGNTEKKAISSSAKKYTLNPELRSKQVAELVHKASIAFCKALLMDREAGIFQSEAPLQPEDVKINVSFEIKKEAWAGKKNTPLVLFSDRLFEGMLEIAEIKQKYEKSGKKMEMLPPSKVLLFHMHGGGFVAMSPKSHEVYLLPWARRFKIPILSVDYGLAPENPFPEAVEDSIHAYNWALANKSKLGWTGEKIVLVGDSAGGNLVAVVTVNQIMKRQRKPDEICMIYPALNMRLSSSPGRLLSTVDPLLNFEFSLRLAAAYVGIPDMPATKMDQAREGPHQLLGTTDTDYLFENLLQRHDMFSSLLMSPLTGPDELLKQFPKSHLWCGTCDPLLDDSVEMAMRLQKLGVPCCLKTFKRVPHGFLTMKIPGHNEELAEVTNDIAAIVAQC